MDRDTMRKRGWSIQSHENNGKPQKDDTFDDAEKATLLSNFPLEQAHASEDTMGPAAKRQKNENGTSSIVNNNNATATSSNDYDERVEAAKGKLSKWAARLFDPNRPRGLVEAPRTIPLNDEFLTAFGKREKEFDDKVGRELNIDEKIVDAEDVDSEEEEDDDKEANTKKLPIEGRKVKILNLAFTTTQETLQTACELCGPVENVNLIMDKERPNLNTGRAYVTFADPQSADSCIVGLTTLDGRPLRVSIAPTETAAKRARRSTGSTARYWVRDISTKCFRCGQVGHMEASCPNAALPKPCPLCGGFDHFDMRACPKSRVCFRCGVPGHINRECAYRQNLPKRVVCGICFQSGHHRCSCRRRATDAPSHDAVCFVCKQHGHFMCKEMKWFFGLDSVSCFNCGRTGHSGYDCDRPGIDMCARDDALADREIERAEALSLADEVEQQSRSRGRDRGRGGGGDRSRAKSQPPPRGNNNGGSSRAQNSKPRAQLRSTKSGGGNQQSRSPGGGGRGRGGQRGYDVGRRR